MKADDILDGLIAAKERSSGLNEVVRLRLLQAELCFMNGNLERAENALRIANDQMLHDEIWEMAQGSDVIPQVAMCLRAKRFDEAMALVLT